MRVSKICATSARLTDGLPTPIGNVIGGVSLVAAINHAQVVAGVERDR